MAKPNETYVYVLVESFKPSVTSGLHGEIHIRPILGQGYPTTLRVQCSKNLSKNYPVGTKFKIKAKLTDREEGGEYLSSSYRWPYEVIQRPT